jgi:5-formyltetrahydrofolate cyclo-ligase
MPPAGPAQRSLPSAKADLRAEALQRRDALDAAFRAEASLRAGALALSMPELSGSPVSGFWPIRSEIDPRPLLLALHARGQALALPAVVPPDLVFRAWAPGEPLERKPFGLSEPSAEASRRPPRILLVPLAAFDRAGGRLGYGRGYYDRTLAALRAQGPAVAIGFAFAAQEVPEVPMGSGDERLDAVVTEEEVIRIPSGALLG